MLWKIRFKYKQMMHEHVIETITADQAEADELAEFYLGDKFGSPNVRMVPPVEPFVALRSLDVPEIALKFSPVKPVASAPVAVPDGIKRNPDGSVFIAPGGAEVSRQPPTPEPSAEAPEPPADPDDEMTAMAGPPAKSVNRGQKQRIGA